MSELVTYLMHLQHAAQIHMAASTASPPNLVAYTSFAIHSRVSKFLQYRDGAVPNPHHQQRAINILKGYVY